MNSNLAKTINYIKRNGFKKTIYAIVERLGEEKSSDYNYSPISEETRLTQIEKSLDLSASFSLLVPAYETNPTYLKALVDSVLAQSYGKWELIIADAGKTDIVASTIAGYSDKRIVYVKLDENKGISGNSNEALKYCSMEYTGLLDHDDLLCRDALFENAVRIEEAKKKDITLQMLYSNEDKTNTENTAFFEPNIKPGFNLDLILSNNYICHFLVLRTELIKKLSFRPEYDGAQDHDLILRAVRKLRAESEDFENRICHIDKVLYHWRCHDNSTAANPMSKRYAYEAGKRAVEDFVNEAGINASVTELPHVGFFRVNYEPDIFSQRKEVCALAGRIVGRNGRIVGGVYDENRNLLFGGLNRHSSGGYLHRAACQMEVPYFDVRASVMNEEAAGAYAEFIKNIDLEKTGYEEVSFRFCELMHKRGYRFVYDPEIEIKVEK